MAHIEIELISLRIGGEMVDAPITLDCWRASILYTSSKDADDILIDGVNWNYQTDVNDQRYSNRIELGGLVVDGKPVNIKHDLRVSINTQKEATVLIVKQYYIP